MKLDRRVGVSLIVGQNEVGVRWDNTDVETDGGRDEALRGCAVQNGKTDWVGRP